MGQAGFSMLEVMLVMVVMTLAVSMLSSTITSTAKMGTLQLENSVASEAARERLEYMRIQTFGELFARFNTEPADDPGGPGTAPGAHFPVPGLTPREGDADGMCGHIRFPEDFGELRESTFDEKLGMPRDLNLDGKISFSDVADSYQLLPVEIQIQWESRGIPREFLVHGVYVKH